MHTPDSLLIPALIGGEIARRFAGRITSRARQVVGLPLPTPQGLAVTPVDLRPAEAHRADEVYAGYFTLAGQTLSTAGESPFAISAPHPEWSEELQRFRWLQHLEKAKTGLARANSAALVKDWIDFWGNQQEGIAWRYDIIAARLIAWLSHAPLLLQGENPVDQTLFLRSIARQVRFLQSNTPRSTSNFSDLHAQIALSMAAICLTGREKSIKSATRALDQELARQILPDGGHVSRNPTTLVDFLTDAIPLREAFVERGYKPSALLMTTIDRSIGALKFFRHSSGDIAQFNGAGSTPTALLSAILRHDESTGRPQQSAPSSGYERLSEGGTTVLVDTGKPISRATSQQALAGTLSFELSSGNTRFISNCGIPDLNPSTYAPFARTTAAHSTATIDDTSSSHFVNENRLGKLLSSPFIRGPEKVAVNRSESKDGIRLVASHDGYERSHCIIHRRELSLADRGGALNGIDYFDVSQDGQLSGDFPVALRFHLAPSVSASLLSSGHSILIAAPNSDAWIFSCVDAPIGLEESIVFSGPGQPRKTEQIVVTGNTKNSPEIRWTFIRRKKNPASRPKTYEEALPDLLEALKTGT